MANRKPSASKPPASFTPGQTIAQWDFNTRIGAFGYIESTIGPKLQMMAGAPHVFIPFTGNGYLRNNDDGTRLRIDGGANASVVKMIYTPSAVGRLYLFGSRERTGVFINPDGSVSENISGPERIVAGAGTIVMNTRRELSLNFGIPLFLSDLGSPVGHSCWKGEADAIQLLY